MTKLTNYIEAKKLAIQTKAYVCVLADSHSGNEYIVPANEKEKGIFIDNGYFPV